MGGKVSSINDVAKHAGVSKSTVSKVLNNYPYISEDTTRKVMEAVTHLEYVPNQTASSLSKKNLKKIGIIFKVNDSDRKLDEMYMQYILGTDFACSEMNIDYSFIFATTLEHKTAKEIVNYLRSKSITNLVVLGLTKDDESIYEAVMLEAFPTVVTEIELVTDKISCVGTNNYKAQYEIAEKYINKYDAKRVLYISGKSCEDVSEQRLRAVKDLQLEQGFELKVENGKFSESLAYQIINESDFNFDIVICASDLMAIGVNRALVKKGYNIPITGFDGSSLIAYAGCNIHTVKQDFYQFAVESVRQAVQMNVQDKGTKKYVDYTLV